MAAQTGTARPEITLVRRRQTLATWIGPWPGGLADKEQIFERRM
jgi:hypothetical protein